VALLAACIAVPNAWMAVPNAFKGKTLEQNQTKIDQALNRFNFYIGDA
jgi:hypothetical protein